MRSYFLLFLAVSAVSARSTSTSSDKDLNIRAPILTSLTAQDPYGFKLTWEPVKSSDNDPILGYKVKVWEQQKQSVYKYEIVDGKKVLVEEEAYAPVKLNNEIPQYAPIEVLTTNHDVHEVSSKNLKPGLTYEFRVQAYTKNGEGPLSAPMSLKFQEPDENDDANRDNYTVA